MPTSSSWSPSTASTRSATSGRSRRPPSRSTPTACSRTAAPASGRVTLNVDTPEGQELARRLIATADVVTANYTPDRLDRWGFDRQTLAVAAAGPDRRQPRRDGPQRPRRRLALLRQRARGDERRSPPTPASTAASRSASARCTPTSPCRTSRRMQILAALHHRDRTGEGCYLEMSQYESSVRLIDVELADVLNGGDDAGPPRQPLGVVRPARHLPGRRRRPLGRHRLSRRRRAGRAGRRDRRAPPTDDAVAAWTSARTARSDRRRAARRRRARSAASRTSPTTRPAPTTRAVWATFDLPSGVTRRGPCTSRSLWDGERLPLRRAPLWMEHTYDVLVDELGLDPGALRRADRVAGPLVGAVSRRPGQQPAGWRRRVPGRTTARAR